MKRKESDMLKQAYISPEVKETELLTEGETMYIKYSGGGDDVDIDEEEDDSDDNPRARKHTIWDYDF
ncbi:MAG: hypothetical protein IKX36_07245 [Prevotella sp.]|nr:hypothetical protein [Prevotella sp.]